MIPLLAFPMILDRIALVAMLLVTPALLNAHALADALISLTAVLFLVQCARDGQWRWLRQGWVPFAIAWWVWEMLCSIPAPPLLQGSWASFGQAAMMVRFFVFAAALENRLLRDPKPRLWLRWMVQAVAAYIGIQCLFQYATGRNFFGFGRWADGELTGPFYKPRAGPELVRILFPAVLPPVMALIARRALIARIAGVLLAGLGIAVMVLIGQRMPVLLTGLGLIVSALLLPRLRLVAISALVIGGIVLAASPIISPPTYYRLVEKFSTQMDHFTTSPYGLLLRRADEITEQHPVFGRGFDGFRNGCPLPRYWVGWNTATTPNDGGGLSTCKQHPHNFYLQASTDGGFPGLVLFCLMVLAWLRDMGRGLWRRPDAVRVGLFAAALLHLWPIASTSAFTSLPVSGYFFVILGWGLAEARWRQPSQTSPVTVTAPISA
ncbi:O-antigen ligase family protein [Acidisoma cladoniae]|uniref:O-antigen ligase family protein n=1 Tax=Acidisoma cladoniae TaxID=3040935 RepID=UPI00254D1D54|nr:O-antigen ligase family protein [Acidisoma sp. PAMC 29798]